MKNKNILFQLLSFAIVGAINTAIDFFVLNLLMWITGMASGVEYSIFKSISFLVAVTNSYFMNKYWTFGNHEKSTRKELVQFFAVSVIGLFINVGGASLVINLYPTSSGLSLPVIGNIGALAGTLLGLVWNFIGYKLIVFRKITQ